MNVLCAIALTVIAGLVLLTAPDAANAVTVSGTAMRDETGTNFQGCHPLVSNLAIAVDGVAAGTTNCNAATGVFTFTGVTIPATGSLVTIWFDGEPGVRGVLYTTAATTGANITNLMLTQNRVWVRSEQVARTVTASELDAFDESQDADIPIQVDSSSVTVASATELHIADATFDSQLDTTTPAIHIATDGTFAPTSWNDIHLTAPGTQPCSFGPGVMRPFCIDAGGTFISNTSGIHYEATSGTQSVEPTTYERVRFENGATRELGYASGQLIDAHDINAAEGAVDSSQFDTDVSAHSIWIDGAARWTGTSSFTITVEETMLGGGAVVLPGADLVLRSTEARNQIGPTDTWNGPNGDWTLHSVELTNGGYQHHAYGQGATGMTSLYSSTPGANNDVVAAIATSWVGTFVVFNQPTNGGDWGIIRYDDDGQPDYDWDDGDANGVDDDGDAVLTFNSGGADIVRVAMADDCSLIVAGSASGEWHARRYDCDGALDTGFFGDGVFNTTEWNGTGTANEIRGMYYSNDTAGAEKFVLVGTESTATARWHVRTYDPFTWANSNNFTWNGGGLGAQVRATCTLNNSQWWGFVVGSVGGAGSRDWAVRRILPDATGWDTINGGSAAWTWNPGGSEDEATACDVGPERMIVGGTTGTGANDDIRVRAFINDNDGYPDSTYGTSGVVSIGGAGDDNLYAVTTEQYTSSAFIGGSDPTNGGRAFVSRIDEDGQLDASWGSGGTITWDQTAGEESVRAIDWSLENGFSGQNLRVGVRDGRNAGDVAIREYDYDGDLQDAVGNGTVRVLVRSPSQPRSINVLDDFTVGRSGDPGDVVLDLESHDPSVNVAGDFTNRIGNTISMSTSSALSIGNDSIFNGTIYANAGTVRFADQSFRSLVSVGAGVQFNNVSITDPDKIIAFETLDPIRVRGTFYVRGASCASTVKLESQSPPTQWTLNLSGGGVADVQYAHVMNANANPIAATATNSRDGGSNTNFTAGGCASPALWAPSGMKVDGVRRARGVSSAAPVLDWFNRTGQDVDRGDVEVYTSPATGQLALWRFDSNGADASGNGYNVTATNGATYGAGRFAQSALLDDVDDWFERTDPGAFSLQKFTVDGWINTTFPGTYNYPDFIYKGNGSGNRINYRIGYDRPTDEAYAEFTTNGGTFHSMMIAPELLADDSWHHVALSAGNGLAQLYVDGVVVGTTTYSGTIDTNTAWNLELGHSIGGRMDDWSVSNVVRSADEIYGYYRTGAPHYQKVWDFDPTDVNGSALGGTYADDTRPSITYAGGAGSLRLDGARYWARARFRTTAGATPPNTWSNWSQWDWFETSQSMTVALVDGPLVSIGGVLSGDDVTRATNVEVTTNNIHGWSASIQGPSDSWGMSDGLPGATHELPIVGTPATPVTWGAGIGGFGVSVLSAAGGKDTARWGTGTLPNDFVNVKWATPVASNSMLLHTRNTFDPALQTLELGLRANAPIGTVPGRFSSTMIVTVIPNL